jgi:Ca-activated chloride channel family protein
VDRKQRQTLVIVLVAILLLLVICCVAGLLSWSWLRRTVIPSPENTLQVTVLYSPEKASWFEPRVSDFNGRAVKVGGRRVEVVAEALDSGEALESIVEGSRTPVVWSPASTLWVPLLNQRWQERTGTGDPLAVYPEPLVVSPVVIAMWQEQAQAMGYPERAVGWQEIISATLDPRGWGLYGHPEWGQFKLGHTNPYFSNSGLLSVAAEGYAAAGKVRDLTPQDLARPATRDYVQKIERAIIHYGESSEYFAQQMAERGLSYASAVVLEEQTVVRLNKGAYGSLAQPLVAIYPTEGTFWSDHPYVVLRGSWVTAEEQGAALAFRDYLLSHDVQVKALEEGFRPADTSIPLANSILNSAVGVDPFQPQTVLEVPSAETLDALLSAWRDVRKKVNVLLVVDISGSMDEADKLPAVQDGLKLFLAQLGDEDVAGVLIFNDQIATLSSLSRLGPKRQQVDQAIDRLQAAYNTVLHDVTIAALREMRQAYDPERINAIVLMSDGQDTASTSRESTMLQALEDSASSDRPVRVFTIAYGGDADRSLLERMARATAGRMVEGTPENIRRLYVILSSYF